MNKLIRVQYEVVFAMRSCHERVCCRRLRYCCDSVVVAVHDLLALVLSRERHVVVPRI